MRHLGNRAVLPVEAVLALRAEVMFHCNTGGLAWNRLMQLKAAGWRLRVEGNAPWGPESPTSQDIGGFVAGLWGDVLQIMVSANIVSKLLFEGRRKPVLRPAFEGLQIPELPHLASLGSRDAIVHVEGRIPGWVRSRLARDPSAKLGPFASGIGVNAPNSYRQLDTASWELRVGTETCNLFAIVAELQIVSRLVPVYSELAIQKRLPDASPT